MDGTSLALCVLVGTSSFVAAYLPVSGHEAQAAETLPDAHAAVRALARRWEGLALVRAARQTARRAERRAAALRQLPTMLDVLTLGLSAGLSFDMSLELYCQRYETELSQAFAEALLTWRIGLSSREGALASLADELDVGALRRFAAAVTQAIAFGAPLAQTLELQAATIRDEQRSEMEAEIERVPVKMLVPLGTLIVPAMLLSILGPLLGSSVGIG